LEPAPLVKTVPGRAPGQDKAVFRGVVILRQKKDWTNREWGLSYAS